MAKSEAKPGDTKKKGKILYRMSSSGKWFKSSNSPKAKAQRKLNARLDAPIAQFQTPQGTIASSTTERGLAHEANAATTVKYGAQGQQLKQVLDQAVQHQKNVGGYFDEYRQRIQALTDQSKAYNAGAQAAMANLPNLVTGLAGQTQGQVSAAQGERGAEQGAIGAYTTGQNLSNAAAIGQSAAGSYAAQSQLIGNAQQGYNDNLLNNVVPAQKVQALTQAGSGIVKAQKDIATQKGVEGAYNEQYRANRRTDENKTLVAEASLGLNSQKASDAASAAKTKAAIDRKKVAETKRHNREMEKAKGNPTAADKERARHNRVMEQLQGDKAKAAKDKKKGQKWVTPEQQNKAGGLAARMKGYAHQLQVGHPPSQKDNDGKPVYPPGVKPGVKYTRSQAASILRQNPDMDEALLSAVLDAAYVGHLSPYTVRKLIAARYKPSQIASSLGTTTRQGMKKKPKKLLADVF